MLTRGPGQRAHRKAAARRIINLSAPESDPVGPVLALSVRTQTASEAQNHRVQMKPFISSAFL